MGDFKYSNAPSMSSISSETYVINTSSSNFYSSATEGGGNSSKMQDDCILEQNSSVKAQQNQVVTSAVAESTAEDPQTHHHLSHEDENKGVNGDTSLSVSVVSSSTPPGSIAGPGTSVLGPPGTGNLPSAAAMAAAAGAGATGPPGVGMVGPGNSGLIEPSALPSSLASSVASLWSPVEDPLMHSGLPQMPNGSLPFPGLGPNGAPGGGGGPSQLFSSNIAPQTLNLGGGPQTGPQRRLQQQPTGAPSFPARQGPSPQAPFLPNKYSTSWSSALGTQGNAWSPGPSQGSGGGGPGGPSTAPGAPSMAGVGSWSRNRAGVGQVSPLGHNLSRVSSSVRNQAKLPSIPTTSAMLINKYQRSTSYPGKGPFPQQPPTFEITGVDDGFPRDLLQFQVGHCDQFLKYL